MLRRTGVAALALSLMLSGCGGESGSSDLVTIPGNGSGGTPPGNGGGDDGVLAEPAGEALSVADVQSVIARAAAQAKADGQPAVIAVTDRVGNVLAVFRMTGARANAVTSAAPNGQNIDAQNLTIPAEAGAIAKALTGAYLSSSGNAFSTRTASMIVQPHFPPSPGTAGLESGPLFGVQFSQLPCSDLSARFGMGMIGPKRSPLGLSADAGGFPLYKNGVVVGGIGVMADGVYGFDPDVTDVDGDAEERIALAGTVGFEAPEGARADRIYVDGTQLRYSDTRYTQLSGTLSTATYAQTAPALGALSPVIGYYGAGGATILAGAIYGSEGSGVRRAKAAEFNDPDAYILTDGAGNNRYPARAGTDAAAVNQPLTSAEVSRLLAEAFGVMREARGQIRQPLDSRAQVSISIVDTHGQVLGIVRAPDAPIFGIDVSLQKARTAAFFSNKRAGDDLAGDPSADVRSFVAATRTFVGNAAALTGTMAFADRSIGNLARPYYPDGQLGTPHGPLSRPIAQFNPFSTGLQTALVLTNLAEHLGFATGASASDTRPRCTFLPDAAPGVNRMQNGMQIFPGSVPIYRGGELVGAIGVSGDGIDQDDMIAFLGLHRAGASLRSIGNAPMDMRADNLFISVADGGARLRYISCPFAPFLGSTEQNVCAGL